MHAIAYKHDPCPPPGERRRASAGAGSHQLQRHGGPALRQWLRHAAACYDQPCKLVQWHEELLEAIASVCNPLLPGRREPRAKKRRPKSYQLLTSPRHQFEEITTANATEPPLNRVPFMPGIFWGRREPRAKKRRPKSYQLLTSPRHQFEEITTANATEPPLNRVPFMPGIFCLLCIFCPPNPSAPP